MTLVDEILWVVGRFGVGGLAVRLRSLAALGLVVLSVAVGLLVAGGTAGRPADRVPGRASSTRMGLSSLPVAARGPVSAVLGGDDRAYRVVGLRAFNPAQQLGLSFSQAGAVVSSGGARVRLALTGVGYASAVRPLAAVRPSVQANRVTYSRTGVREWYLNGPLGVEQGFELLARPRAAAGPLTLSVALGGDMRARLDHGSVLLAAGGHTLRYGDLSVTDARGRALPAWLGLAPGRVLIRIDDRDARYPLRVDPFVQQGPKLTPNDENNTGGGGRFGESVAISSNGSTLLVGGYGDNGGVGAAWVFVRSGSTWTQQGSKLTAPKQGDGCDGSGTNGFGFSVALSANGNTALIGAPYYCTDTESGTAWVFVRSGTTWTKQAQLLPNDEDDSQAEVEFGTSVALSSDGDTALIGGPFDYHGRSNGSDVYGSAWVFVRSSSTWSQQGSRLAPADEGNDDFGEEVALSGDGNTALIGGVGVNDVWVFVRSGTTWSQQGSKLPGGGQSSSLSLALSSDGNTALIGGPANDSIAGEVWVFVRSGTTWTQQGPTLTANDESGKGAFGTSVALSGDGNTALIGGNGDSSDAGAAWVFTRAGSTWTQQGSKLTGTGEVNSPSGGRFGGSVALSSDASTAVIGGNDDNADAGAAWVFTAGNTISGTVTDQNGTPLAGVQVNLSGTDQTTGQPVSEQTTSGSDGSYSFTVDPGSYTVTVPEPSGASEPRYIVSSCSGTGSPPDTCAITIPSSGGSGSANFQLAPLIVNSTGVQDDTATDLSSGVCNVNLTGPQACTLPAAIQVANQLGGGTISFDIPSQVNGVDNTFDGSVPWIQDRTGKSISAVKAQTTIDGTSQPGAGKVELSGTSGHNTNAGSPTVGLALAGAGSTVKGLVVNGYSDDVDVNGGGAKLIGDWFGTDAAGTAADPDPLGTNTEDNQKLALIGVALKSSGNTVGGAGAGEGDVFATHWNIDPGHQFRLASALYDTTGGNVIQGDSIGVVPGTHTALMDPQPAGALPSSGLGVSGVDTIGGTASGDGNVVAPQASIDGASVVQGNTFLGTLYADGAITIGGATTSYGTGRGNVFAPSSNDFVDSDRELEISGADGVVQGNRFDPTGDPAIVDTGSITIGGSVASLGNLIEDTATEKPGPEGRPGLDGAIVIAGGENTVENNTLTDNGGWGAVQVQEGKGNTITRNTMSGNTEGIEFGTLGYLYDTDVTKSSSGPNNLEYYPILFSTSSGSSGTTVSGRIEQSGTVTVDLYSEKGCALQAEAEGQGEHYLGSTTVSSTLGGEDFSFTAAPTPSGQGAITATATASDGSTSEFSPCLITDSHAPTLVGYGVRPATTSVAITTTTSSSAAAIPTNSSRTSSKQTGEGTLWLLCPANTKGSCTGRAVIKTTTSKPVTITNQSFTMPAGSAAKLTIKLTGTTLAKLEKDHKLKANLTTTAKDTAKPPHTQTYKRQIELTVA